jgi:uncharacterized repeat protein (TIGR03803 family)
MNPRDAFRHLPKPLLTTLLLASATAPVLAQTWPPAPLSEATLYSFSGGADGASPAWVTLQADEKGALYGTTALGGGGGSGTVFKLTPPGPGKSQWSETTLYSFSGGADGGTPTAGLARDYSGALYGVTTVGGAAGQGVAYKLTPPVPPSTQWSYAKIFDFVASMGANTYTAPSLDGAGALVGVAANGGASGGGTIYKLTPPASSGGQWTGVALYNFASGADSGNLYATLVVDTSGAIYGTSLLGGSAGYGAVLKLTPPDANCAPVAPNLWCKTVLHDFGGSDGAKPMSGLTMDKSSGLLYGTTLQGGANNKGVVFSLTPPVPPSTQWLETVLYSFTGGQDDSAPDVPLTLMGGALYGATSGRNGYGTLFELAPPAAPTMHWTENVLYRFTGGSDGGFPGGGLTFNAFRFGAGLAIYGVAGAGGASNFGTVFSLQCAKAAREVFGGAQHTACAQ